MKKIKLLIIGVASLVLATVTQAQTDPPPVTVPIPTNGFWAGIGHAAGDAWSDLKNASFANGIDATPFGLKHKSDWGAGIAVSTIPTNGNVLSLGFALATIQEPQLNAKTGKTTKAFKFYDASLSIQANGTLTIPYLGWKVPTYLETGPATDLSNPTVLYEQSFTGVRETWDMNGNWSIGLNLAAGHCSKWSGDIIYLAGLELNCKLKGKRLLGLF